MTDGDWSNERRETAHEEAQAVIRAQNDSIASIDDKAHRTVRLNALLVGLLIAGVEYAPDAFHNESLYATFGALVLSTLLGILTFSETNLYLGPKGEYIHNLSKGDVDNPWGDDLAELYSGMIAENYDDVMWNARILQLSLSLLAIAIISAVVSIII